MPNDFEIGRVVAVDTAQVTIELNADMKALTRATYEHTITVGQINSYVILPVGASKIVGMVTRVMMTEEAELKVDKTMVALPSARRLMKATMIGAIDGGEFRQGISIFPVLDNPVLVARSGDLDAIFDCQDTSGDVCSTTKMPGYCVNIGHSAVFPDYQVQINPDLFFGKHAAILGSTGSGKSCSVATLIQSVLQAEGVRNAHFVILDTNGEYAAAFPRVQTGAAPGCRVLNVSPDPDKGDGAIAIPYWFMNADEFTRLFRAAPGIQRPVLLEALRSARLPSAMRSRGAQLREMLIKGLGSILNYVHGSSECSKQVEDIAVGLSNLIQNNVKDLADCPRRSDLVAALPEVAVLARKHVGEPERRRFSNILPPDVQDQIAQALEPLLSDLTVPPETDAAAPADSTLTSVSTDAPLYFGKTEFRHRYLESAITAIDAGAKSRDYCATMLMRMHRLLDDERFSFLFGPVDGEWPEPADSLAAFLRDIMGLRPAGSGLSDEETVPRGGLPFYDRQREGNPGASNIVVVDLSLLASEVLENVTALLGRLILEFLQRLGTNESGVERGSLPIVLVLEEAQNYIRETHRLEEESISRSVFERIAREGRKYGLSLVVASQRPSELSKTVLSQCNSFIVHRLQNPEDLRYFREIVPGIYEQMLGQLPALAQQNALVLGECVRAPALVHMREASPRPDSLDPKFHQHWTAQDPKLPDVEALCAAWEGKSQATGNQQESGAGVAISSALDPQPEAAEENTEETAEDLDYDPFAED